jgi:hypothetical protein
MQLDKRDAAALTIASTARRSAACPCGSAKRYKHCCGRLTALAAPADATAVVARRAALLMNAGEADAAARVLSRLQPADVRDAGVALEAGEIHLDLHALSRAKQWLQHAVDLAGDQPRLAQARAECDRLLGRSADWQRVHGDVRACLARLNARTRNRNSSRHEQVHIVCKLDTIGGSERRAINLYRRLSAHAQVTLWSTLPVHVAHTEVPIRQITPDDAPAGGVLVLVGTYFDCAPWLQAKVFDRIVICHNLSEQHTSLLQRLQQIEANASRPQVRLTFPSALFRDHCGLPGLIEYSPIDFERFVRSSPAKNSSKLRIGRHARAYPWKFHPNDPAFFRRLIGHGHAVRILGGSVIAEAFAHDALWPELLDVGALDACEFLDSLDVFVYRKHPRLFETGGTAILEAMAMQLPVIVFAEDCGSAELIEHGRNGFLVATEAEALVCIDKLQTDTELRARMGHAARATVVELMRQQDPAVLAYYLEP